MKGRLLALRRTPIGHAVETVALLASIGYAVVSVFDKVDRYRRHVTHDDTAPDPYVAIPVGDDPPPWPGHVAAQVHQAQEHAAATMAPGWQDRLRKQDTPASPSELLEELDEAPVDDATA